MKKRNVVRDLVHGEQGGPGSSSRRLPRLVVSQRSDSCWGSCNLKLLYDTVRTGMGKLIWLCVSNGYERFVISEPSGRWRDREVSDGDQNSFQFAVISELFQLLNYLLEKKQIQINAFWSGDGEPGPPPGPQCKVVQDYSDFLLLCGKKFSWAV